MSEQDDDRYLSLDELAVYSGLSTRTLRRHLKTDPPIPHYRVGVRVLVKRSEFDRWLQLTGTTPRGSSTPGMDERVARAVKSMKGL